MLIHCESFTAPKETCLGLSFRISPWTRLAKKKGGGEDRVGGSLDRKVRPISFLFLSFNDKGEDSAFAASNLLNCGYRF